MKKIVLSFALVITAGLSQAQITITTADGPALNTVIIAGIDTTFSVGPGASGASQTWDFSLMQNQGSDTTVFASPSGTPAASSFASSNLVIANPSDSTWVYLTNNSSGVTIDGYYLADPALGTLTVDFNPSQQLVTFPSTYLTTYNNTAVFEFATAYNSPPVDSVRVKQTVIQNSSMDGWGSLTTPTGTFSVIRQNENMVTIDSTWGRAFGTWTFISATNDTSNNYRWWANGMGYPVAEMSTDNSGNVTSSSYLIATSAAVNETAAQYPAASVFPNPAGNQLTVRYEEPGFNLTITDISGRIIENRSVQNSSVTLDVSGYMPGNYFYTLINSKGEITNGKIIIVR